MVGMVKHGCGLLGDGPLKSAVSQEWVYEFSWMQVHIQAAFELSFEFQFALSIPSVASF